MAEIRNTTAPGDAPDTDEHATQQDAYTREASNPERAAATADPDEASYLEVRERKFKVKDDVPTHLAMKIAAAASEEDVVSICGKWAPKIIVEGERNAFDNFMIDADPVIGSTEYMKMFTDLMELVGGRPTAR